jgi:signal transduction histidine kinase
MFEQEVLQPSQLLDTECEMERKRIAHEIHDQVIQTLIGINYQISHLRTESPQDLDTHLANIQCQLRALVHTARGICTDLRRAPIDLLGFMRAVNDIVAAIDHIAPFTVRTSIQGDRTHSLHHEAALCLVRVLQETLMNVYRHAAAREVIVQLQITAETITLTVCDDGDGFRVAEAEATASLTNHFGIAGMQERVERVGGRFHITSTPGHGTRVEVQVPCNSG